jgi:hypothetical protein
VVLADADAASQPAWLGEPRCGSATARSPQQLSGDRGSKLPDPRSTLLDAGSTLLDAGSTLLDAGSTQLLDWRSAPANASLSPRHFVRGPR